MNEWIIKMLVLVFGAATPEIRESIVSWVNELEQRAKETPNPMDDILVGLLKILLHI